MHIKLSAEMNAYIKSKVASGFYGNATEVIRDAIRRMQAGEPQSPRATQGVAKAPPSKG